MPRGIYKRTKRHRGENSPHYGKKHSKETKEKMRLIKLGKNNPCWKGGRRVDSNGYILIKEWNHPHTSKSGYLLEHRLVMEEKLGRYLKPYEFVHHIDGNKQNNALYNLCLTNSKEHGASYADGFRAGFMQAFALLFITLLKRRTDAV